MPAKKLFPFLLFFSLACGIFAPVPIPTPTLAPVISTSTQDAQLTATPDLAATESFSATQTETALAAFTDTPVPTATQIVNPADLVEQENPVPPPAVSPGEGYRLEEDVKIGAYGIRYWRDTDSETGFDDLILIEKNGMETIRIEQAAEINPLTGNDINGDGYPEAILESYTGGAHCCFGLQVYSLQEEGAVLNLQKPESNASGEFKDLDEDGVYEFVTYDDIFAYQYCPFVSSPAVKVVMAYDPVQEKYLPASPSFPEVYAEAIEHDTQNAERVAKAKTFENGEWDETSKCSILPLMLDYIYLGDLETARSEMERLYIYDDGEEFWNEVMFIIRDSSLYVESAQEE